MRGAAAGEDRRAQLQLGAFAGWRGTVLAFVVLAQDNFKVLIATEIGNTHIDLNSISVREATHVAFGKESVGKEREEDEFG